MECRSKLTGNESLAVVIRQFNPSRIERELLARAFEVVVAGPVGRPEPLVMSLGGEGQHTALNDHVEAATRPALTRSVA